MTADGASPDPESTDVSIRQLLRDLAGLARGPLLILVLAPLCLTAMEYYGMPWHYAQQQGDVTIHDIPSLSLQGAGPRAPTAPFAEHIGAIAMPGPPSVQPFLWWSLACLVLFVLVPLFATWLGAGLGPRSLGLRVRGTGKHGKTYALLFLCMLPVIWFVSRRPDFQATYPYFREAARMTDPAFLLFEAAYAVQFFAVEFFFRGFLVLGLKRWLGWSSVLVMLTPYCMLHFHMPLPEALGAIGGGAVLGVLAYRSGTIWWGVLLHCAVALSMDLLALFHTGRLH